MEFRGCPGGLPLGEGQRGRLAATVERRQNGDVMAYGEVWT